MRKKTFWIAALCGLTLLGLVPTLSSGTPPASKEKVIYSFQGGADGAYPESRLVADAAGNLYGTTSGGGTGCGSNGCGTVFELTPTSTGWKEQVIYTFADGKDGQYPVAGLILDGRGNLYGTTRGTDYRCVTGTCGTVFELTPAKSGWQATLLYSFTGGSDGLGSSTELIFDTSGNLYGTTIHGGFGGNECIIGCGTVIELTPQKDGTWAETTIHQFTGGADGGFPSSALVLDSEGNLYGTASGGNSSASCTHLAGCGTVYQLSPAGAGKWVNNVLYTFVRGGGFGIFPTGGTLFAGDSHIYGLASAGGDHYGSAFSLERAKSGIWQQRDLHIFFGKPDGAYPVGMLVADKEGNLYGVTREGGHGAPGNGVVFELQPSSKGWREIALHRFGQGSSGDGLYPAAGAVLNPNGRLYGTTFEGGDGTGCPYGCGTIYELTP